MVICEGLNESVINCRSFFKTQFRPVKYLSLGLACIFTSQARALHCEFTKLYTDNISIPVVGLGISTAGEDVPVGKILYRQTIEVPAELHHSHVPLSLKILHPRHTQ